MEKITVLLYSFLILEIQSTAQTTLGDIIDLAKRNSYTSKLSQNELILADLAYTRFRIGLKPTLGFYGNAPVYNKDNYAVTQPDGSIKFLNRSQNYSNLGVGFSQPVPLTGGTIALNTDLYRFDDFAAKTKQYNGTPFFIRLTQPLFKYNPNKWDKQIEPLKLQEANQTLKISMMQLEYDACRLYFDIIEAQCNEELLVTNNRYIETNIAIEKRRVQLGVSTEDKVLQLEIQQIYSQQQQMAEHLNIRKAFLSLQTFINSKDTTIKHLQLPEQLPSINIDKERAIASSKQNLPQYLSFQRKRLETQSKTAEAKAHGRQIDIVASYGLNNASTNVSGIYRNPQDQQRFSVGFNVPIADWGRRKNNLAVFKIQEEQVEIINKMEEEKLIAEITILMNELPVLQRNIHQSLMLDTLSQRRFIITNRLFQASKASLSELQTSQIEKDNLRRNYISALRRFWEAYYLLKTKTGGEF